MKIGDAVEWHKDVFPCWQRAATHPAPNVDIWEALPAGVRWFQATVEEADRERLYLIGSSDLRETFGSYRLCEISPDMAGDDKYDHKRRIREIARSIGRGQKIERSIAVSSSTQGPFILLDGNHRFLGYLKAGRLIGAQLYLGIFPELLDRFKWAWHLKETA